MYWPALGWVFGLLTELPIGLFVYSWLSMEALIELGAVVTPMDTNAWFMGPFRRSVMGWYIFGMNVLFTIIPFTNFVVPFVGIDWAIADYNDYYMLIVPNPNAPPTEDA